MLWLRHFTAVTMLAGGAALGACGSVDDTTTCTLAGSCGTSDASPHPDSGTQDTGSPDTRQCSPGDTKKQDCNDCICTVDGLWECTHHDCPDTGPPNSPCPEVANPGGACTGNPLCIYHSPCDFGCDCVSDKWLCGLCPG